MTCTTEEYKEKIKNSRNDYKEFNIVGEYKNSNTNIDIFHIKCNNLFNMRASVFLNGMSCPKCRISKIKDTTKSFKEKIQNKRKDYKDFEIIGEYINAKEKIEIKHLVCNKSFFMKPGNFVNLLHNCPRCSSNSLVHITTVLELQKMINDVSNGYELVNEIPKKFSEKVHLLHSVCGKVYTTTLSNFLSTTKPRRCHHCSGNKKLSLNEIKHSIESSDKNTFKLISTVYENVHGKIKVFHTECNREFLTTYNHFRNGDRCPFCSNIVNSKAVLDIVDFLNSKNILYKREYTYSDLVSDKGKVLRFDFYFPEYNVLLEYDGKQHFVYNENTIFNKETFLRIKKHDKMKDEYCLNNNIRLVRINYKENHLELISQLFPDDDYTNNR